MDRLISNIGESIYEWMFSKPDQNKMVALAKLSAAVFGTSTICNGLSASPTSPASLQIQIGAGEIYQLANLENTVCGTLPKDTTHQIVKQGIQLGTYTTSAGALAAPGTAGQSINYLIEAQYADLDVSIDPTTGNTPVVLQFYDSSNPTQPYSGPNNSGQTSNTFRTGIVSLQVKAGTAATTGSQVTPSPDAEWVGLWVVTVANGQSTVTSGNITAYPGAPVLSASLLAQIQARALINGDSTQVFSVAPATASRHAVQLGQVGHGQCRLTATSATNLKLTPFGGNNLVINGVPYQIPSAGVSISNASLSASTLYYVYAFMSAGVMTLELSLTSHETNSNGIEIKIGDATRTLVGMIYTTSSSQFQDASTGRLVLNWFGRRALSATVSGSGYTFSSTSAAKISTAIDLPILTWGEESFYASIDGSFSNNTAGQSCQVQLYIDGSAWGSYVNSVFPSSNSGEGFSTSTAIAFTEGFHTISLYGSVTSGVGTISNASNKILLRG